MLTYLQGYLYIHICKYNIEFFCERAFQLVQKAVARQEYENAVGHDAAALQQHISDAVLRSTERARAAPYVRETSMLCVTREASHDKDD